MMSMKILQFSRPPTPSCLSASEIPPISRPWTSNFKRTLPPSPTDNKSVKRRHNPKITIMLSGTSFRSAFFFIWLKPNYLILRGFILLCVQLPKNITKCLLFIFSTHFAINLFYLHNLKT